MASGDGDLWVQIMEEGVNGGKPGVHHVGLGRENIGILSRKKMVPALRDSWNRSLSTRGRTSIAAIVCVEQPPRERPRRGRKPPVPRGKKWKEPNFEKERAYFQEVDDFELLVESPSPKKPNTWVSDTKVDDVAAIDNLSSVLRKWLISKKLNRKYSFVGSLPRVLETPLLHEDPICHAALPSSRLTSGKYNVDVCSNSNRVCNSSLHKENICGDTLQETCEKIEHEVKELSLNSRSSSPYGKGAFSALLTACGQSIPSFFKDVLFNCDGVSIVKKVGEGTYGEAFIVGSNVCKIVPFDGDVLVNGVLPKKSEELLEEVVLSCTLNHLRGDDLQSNNACSTFIKTLDVRICEGRYDSQLTRAWEEWDAKHSSENDHPKYFPENQRYVVFVQEHGGEDLERFVLSSFDEARSLLLQVTLALAVAEAAYEFEHRDLHWGNILLNRNNAAATTVFVLEGKKFHAKTFGLAVSIIDFTLSRINTGEDILFLDLSSDPELFEGPTGDIQAEIYRKMRKVTGECWNGSFPKTNVLWLQYLVDVLLTKKSYERTTKNERDLRCLKKQLNSYGSAKEAVSDTFFTDLLLIQP